jgi:hypothetical protein
VLLAKCGEYVARFDPAPAERLVVSGGSLRENMEFALPMVRTSLVAFIEDDDWYRPDHLGVLESLMRRAGSGIAGLNPTFYYHILRRRHVLLPHAGRASLFATMARSDSARRRLAACGPGDFVDIGMWAAGPGALSPEWTAVGVKHGLTPVVGMGHACAGPGWADDPGMELLESVVGPADAGFYRSLASEWAL